MANLRIINTAAFRHNDILKNAVCDGRAGQKTGAAIDWADRIIEFKRRGWASEGQVGFVEGANRADILPVSVEIVPVDLVGINRLRNHVAAKIIKALTLENVYQYVGIEKIDAH
jgi:hypothetical protein